jgi:hypothetical protein
MRRRRPRQAVGDPCEDCGTALVLCIQCGINSRCLECCPYERPSAREQEIHAFVRMVREHPRIGLLAGTLAAVVPAALIWAGTQYVPPGGLRTVGALAGAAACCAGLATGAAIGRLPDPGQIPACRAYDRTPFDRWSLVAFWAFLIQVAAICASVSTG